MKKGSLGVPAHATGMDDDPAELKSARPFDKALLQMMIAHQVGAIGMARAEQPKGKDPELKALAEETITAQEREINEMRDTSAWQARAQPARATTSMAPATSSERVAGGDRVSRSPDVRCER